MKNSNWILAFLIALPLTTLAADNTGLVLRLSLNDPYALVAIDSSGLANDGQLAGQVYLQPDPLMGGAAGAAVRRILRRDQRRPAFQPPARGAGNRSRLYRQGARRQRSLACSREALN